MSATTSIEWTDRSWNPVRGCSLVSDGCKFCYAMKVAHRFSGPGKPYEGLTRIGPHGPTWTGAVRLVPEALDEPLHWRRPQRIFVNSMSDLFHPDVPDAFIDRVFAVMALCPQHTFQVLTKRAERMRSYLAMESADGDRCDYIAAAANEIESERDGRMSVTFIKRGAWPLPNVWLGVSAENQPMYDKRIRDLLLTPAAVRFLSLEPLLGPIDMRMGGASMPDYSAHNPLPQVNWVIVGGESGPGARPFDVAWARSIVQQCRSAGVPVFVKQLGSRPTGWYTNANGPMVNCNTQHDKKGGDPSEWPEDLRVREFPA